MNFKNLCRKLLASVFLILIATPFVLGSIVVLNGLTHENTVAPGETYRGSIEIQNTADTEKSVRVYIRDYIFNFKGESKHDAPGTVARSNSGWIAYNPQLLNLAGGEKATIDFEVKVPTNDSLKGTYWSVLMVEGIIPPDTTTHEQGVTINTAIRYAIQVVTQIGNSGTSDLQFLGLELEKQDKNNILNVFVENTGERQLRPELALELFDENGNSAGVLKAERRKTFPGTSVKLGLNLEGIKPGKYTGVLVADCDEDHVFGTNVSIEIE